MLGAAGYSTYAAGKWHLTPPDQMSPAGPFDQWPLGRGFDRYYGFLWGEDDQWTPELWCDNHRVDPPNRPGYHLSEDLVDTSSAFLADHVAANPSRPFFLYLAFGACHAPHQAPREFIERYRGKFDGGWDVMREETLARQIQLGVVPCGTSLAPRNPDVPPWASLSDSERRVFARMQEVFAGFLTHTDVQIGRLIAFLERQGLLDDTLFVVLSDNGASGEGGRYGSVNEYRYFLGLPDTFTDSLSAMDGLGGPCYHNHYPAGWAQAGNTPLKFYKKYTYGGGVRAPLLIQWPRGIRDAGGIRTQFHHVIDLVPTVLDLTGVEPPTTYHGIPQMPIHGTSMAYLFDDATAPTRREIQYFEMIGHRGIWSNGWKAVTCHERGAAYDTESWELFRLDEDYAETRDLSLKNPEMLSSLVEKWWVEAHKYDVLPLDDRQQDRALATDPHLSSRTEWGLLPGTRLLNSSVGPQFAGKSFVVTAEVDNSGVSAKGVLLAYGRRAAGFSFFVHDGLLHVDYNLAGEHTVIVAEEPVPARPCALQWALMSRPDGSADIELRIDERTVAKNYLRRTLPSGFGGLSTQCGHNAPSAVSTLYESPNAYSGVLHRVTIQLSDATSEIQQEGDMARSAVAWTSALGQE
jgi:arylsulfatase